MALPNWMTMSWLDKYRDAGLLLMRVGAGVIFLFIGWDVFAGGEATWEHTGHQVRVIGIHAAPVAFGLGIAIAKMLGGLCVLLGFATRFAATLIFLTLLLPYLQVWDAGVERWSPFALAGLLFLGLMVMGPGRYSLDVRNADEIADH